MNLRVLRRGERGGIMRIQSRRRVGGIESARGRGNGESGMRFDGEVWLDGRNGTCGKSKSEREVD